METGDVKQIYNKAVPGQQYKGDYETKRWFSNKILKSGYRMTRKSIEKHLIGGDLEFSNYLELGPGAGTWTEIFCEKYKGQTSFDLIDISREMLVLSKKKLSKYENLRFFETDFIEFKLDKKYDLFFSSRAIEYFPNKDVLIKKIAGLLEDGGSGFIITKTPKYMVNRILGRKTNKFHSMQIDHRGLSKILEKNNLKVMGVYPVVLSFPIFKSVFLNEFLFSLFSSFKLSFVSALFSESYCVKFKKNDH